MALNHLSKDNPLHAVESSLASKGYPEDAKLFLDALFGEFTNCYVEVRLIRGESVLQFFYPSISAVAWGLIKGKNSEGYNCYFGVCLRKTQKGDKASVASISGLWADVDAKNFSGGKSEALAQLQELPPYLFPSVIIDTGHGYHPYWLLREAELIESPQDILRLEAYMKGLALTLHGDSTSDLSRVLRLPGLVNRKDAKNPCLCHIIHWEPERRFNPTDFADYQAEIREVPKSKPQAKGDRRKHTEEFNALAIEKLLESCNFVQDCKDAAATLPESRWWSMCQILSFLGEPGKEKAHELSQPYPKYTEAETNKKLEYAKEAVDKSVGPHTCAYIEKDLHFACPADCLAKKWGLKSPIVLATRLARTAGLPTIVCSGRHLREESADALQALYQANTPERIFRRGGALCRISKDELNRPMIELLTEAALRGHMERSANFIKHNAKGEAFVVPPPLEIVRDVQSLGDWQFPALLGITEAPIIRPDGTVLATPGYDSATDLYYAPTPGLVVSPIPENPTDSEVRTAIELLLEVICDFPFVDEASHANAVGELMVAILRPLMGLAPMAVLDKPQPGTGASLLADVISIVATGRPAATMGEPRSEEECEKKLNSHLLEGRSLCIIDNVDGKLWSDTLARFLTSPYLSVRPLGRSADLRLRNSLTYVVTGNNIQLGGDLPRRCFWVRLNAQLARPWLRDGFRHPRLTEWLAENRGAILAAVLTIARAWVVAGRPENLELLVLGGYEDFCCVVGNILDFMGVKGFLANLTAMYDTMDKDTPQWEAFLETWREVIGDVPVTVKELIKKLDDLEELSNSLPEGLATRDERNYSRRLGNALAKRAEVHHPNGMVLVKAGTRHRASLWRVIQKIANSPGFSFKSELSELSSTLPHTEKSEGKNIYIERVGANSPNSPLATGQIRKPNSPFSDDLWEGMPDHPKEPCHACGGTDFWPDFEDKRFICSRCHPQPPEIDMEV